MFSPDKLIHYVFANENDIYYGEDLLALNLNQFLWLNLHKSGYQSVFFLEKDPENPKAFSVQTFGDVKAPTPQKKSGLFGGVGKKENKAFASWFLKRIEDDRNRSAFVCSLADFCNVLSDPGWQSMLTTIAEAKKFGVIVLTAPVIAENSVQYFLNSRVFNMLGEQAVLNVRNDAEHGMTAGVYSSLQYELGNACVFLNVVTKERLKGILARITAEYPARFCDTVLYTDLLFHCLYSRELYAMYPLFGRELPTNLYYSYLYDSLKREDAWSTLTRLAEAVGAAGGIRPFLKNAGISVSSSDKQRFGILRSEHSPEGECLRIRIPEAYSETEGGESAQSILLAIKENLFDPQNCPPNKDYQKTLKELCGRLQFAQKRSDWRTYKRILEAIRFVSRWLYVAKESEQAEKIDSIIRQYKDAATLSENLSAREQQLQSARQKYSNEVWDKVNTKAILQQQTIIEQERHKLEGIDICIRTAISNLSVDAGGEPISPAVSQAAVQQTISTVLQTDDETDEFERAPDYYAKIPTTISNNE